MGGKSESNQKTSSSQQTTNIVNDGQFAGAQGVDASRTDIDYDVDNSVRYDLDQDIDNSVRNDYDLDQDIDNSQHLDQDIDNSIRYDGEFAGVSGTVNVLDGGAIEAGMGVALSGMDAAVDAMRIGGNLGEHALSEMGNSVDTMAGVSEYALDEMGDLSADALSEMGSTTNNALQLAEYGMGEMASVTNDAFELVGDVSQVALDANSYVSENALSEMGGLSGDALDLAQYAIGEASDVNRDLADNYLSALNDASASNADYMATVTSDNLNAMGDLSSHAIESMNGLATELGTGNQALMHSMGEQLSEGFSEGVSTIAALSDNTSTTLANSHQANLEVIANLSGDVLSNNQNLINSMTSNLGDAHSENLASLADTQQNIGEFLAEATKDNINANNAALTQVAALAKSTSLQGQDLVADSASKMIKYVSIAMGIGVSVIAVALVVRGSK
ncbi:hypothetical protein CWB73_00480 [Pseudoalteromonas phenolica]|uniref:Uncharacterized protein n=1 Tax=Pseudoalteromonas phenolica TaxID=161398 RepID=A0A5S3YZ76_9GAMM|nr:hypothetical protein [Pseudoalteromonas phenolica]TMP84176.1 hypothetical protein CWB73_00480 [Pseudoalteromonas phenolica]